MPRDKSRQVLEGMEGTWSRELKISLRRRLNPFRRQSPALRRDVRQYCPRILSGAAVSQSLLVHPWMALYGLMTVPSRAERPFQAIWTPMQSRMKAITRRTPWAVEGGMALETFGAYA